MHTIIKTMICVNLLPVLHLQPLDYQAEDIHDMLNHNRVPLADETYLTVQQIMRDVVKKPVAHAKMTHVMQLTRPRTEKIYQETSMNIMNESP